MLLLTLQRRRLSRAGQASNDLGLEVLGWNEEDCPVPYYRHLYSFCEALILAVL